MMMMIKAIILIIIDQFNAFLIYLYADLNKRVDNYKVSTIHTTAAIQHRTI
jgi:hypothetical protein